MKIRAVTIYWDDECDHVALVWNPQFNELDWIAKADVIKDAMHDLNLRYVEVLTNER